MDCVYKKQCENYNGKSQSEINRFSKFTKFNDNQIILVEVLFQYPSNF